MGDESIIVGLDFDGVLSGYRHGWQGEEPAEEPVPGAREFVLWLYERGYTPVIVSTRASTPSRIEWMRQYLAKHSFPSMPITDQKIHCHLYIDDRAFRFDGKFGPVVDFLKANPKPSRWELNLT